MRNFRLAAILLLLFPALCRAENDATVFLDATVAAAATTSAASASPLPGGVISWARWARLDKGRPLAATASPGLSVRASRFPGGVGAAIANTSNDTVKVRMTLRLPRGLWRTDAALVLPSGDAALPQAAARVWRLESAFLTKTGPAAKTVAVRPGQILFFRVTETVVTAQAALGETVQARRSAGSPVSGRVGRALAPVEQALNGLPALVVRGDRAAITKKVHRALLAAAQAQAQWKNERGSALASQDTAFDGLMTALSEISCAACNLVPGQTEIVGEGGARSLRISVMNAGTRTVPLLSLGVNDTGEGSPTTESGDMTVFRQLNPGSRVGATFAAPGPTAHGIVQFILGMGAAVIPVLPGP